LSIFSKYTITFAILTAGFTGLTTKFSSKLTVSLSSPLPFSTAATFGSFLGTSVYSALAGSGASCFNSMLSNLLKKSS
jgi:hypothetical protein